MNDGRKTCIQSTESKSEGKITYSQVKENKHELLYCASDPKKNHNKQKHCMIVKFFDRTEPAATSSYNAFLHFKP